MFRVQGYFSIVSAIDEQILERAFTDLHNFFCSKDEIKTNADEMREGQEMERMLSRMTLRQRRSYLRKLERGDDVSGIVGKNEDSDFDFEDSDLEEEDEEESEDESDEKEEEAKK